MRGGFIVLAKVFLLASALLSIAQFCEDNRSSNNLSSGNFFFQYL